LSGELQNILDADAESSMDESLIILSKPLVIKNLEKVTATATITKTVVKDLDMEKSTDTKSKAFAQNQKPGFSKSITTYGFLQSLDSKLVCKEEKKHLLL
jgi:hypothetical protein